MHIFDVALYTGITFGQHEIKEVGGLAWNTTLIGVEKVEIQRFACQIERNREHIYLAYS